MIIYRSPLDGASISLEVNSSRFIIRFRFPEEVSRADKEKSQFALVTRRPYCPGGPKKLCFTTLSLIPMGSIARLSVVKQSSFGLPGQYGRRVTRVNETREIIVLSHFKQQAASAFKRFKCITNENGSIYKSTLERVDSRKLMEMEAPSDRLLLFKTGIKK